MFFERYVHLCQPIRSNLFHVLSRSGKRLIMESEQSSSDRVAIAGTSCVSVPIHIFICHLLANMHPAKEENMRLATEENMRPATEENMRPATEETPLLPRYTPTTRRQSNGRQSSRTLPRFRNVLALVSVVWTGLLLFYWRIYASQPPVPPSQPSVPPSQPPAPPDPYQIAVIGKGSISWSTI